MDCPPARPLPLYFIMLRTIVEPTHPFNVETDLRPHLRADHTEDDGLIDFYAQAALYHVQDFTRRAVTTQTLELVLDEFPSVIQLPRPPVQSITSITYVDSDGQPQTFEDFELAGTRVLPAYGSWWPATRAVPEAVTVRYVAGYEEVPHALRAAMLLVVGDLYEHREAQQDRRLSSNDTVERLLGPYRWF